MPQMWIPCVVFAHLFAFSFLLSMVKVSNPAAWEGAKRRLGRLVGRRRSGDGTAPTAAAIAAATAASKSGECGICAISAACLPQAVAGTSGDTPK